MNFLLQSFIVSVFFIFTVLISPVLAQVSNDIKFEYLTTEDGLTDNIVYSVLQDRNGFMWFGTQYGLNKYDGNGFTSYTNNQDDPNSLSSNTVWTLLEARTGTLWISGWGAGLNKFDPVTETFVRYQHDDNNSNSLSNNNIDSIYEDSWGMLWFATEKGLNKFDPVTETFAHYLNDPNNSNSLRV